MLRCYRIERGSLRIEQLGQRGSIVSLKHRTTRIKPVRARLRQGSYRPKDRIAEYGINLGSLRIQRCSAKYEYVAGQSVAM